MYEKCIGCDRLGKDCIPNLYVMDVEEIREWARAQKEYKGLTNAELSALSGVPKGTIDHSFSARAGKHVDVNYSTIAPILCALIGADSQEMPCSVTEAKREENTDLEKEYVARIERMDALLKWRKQVIVFLIVLCCILLDFVLAGIVVDFLDSEIGFFWR